MEFPAFSLYKNQAFHVWPVFSLQLLQWEHCRFSLPVKWEEEQVNLNWIAFAKVGGSEYATLATEGPVV